MQATGEQKTIRVQPGVIMLPMFRVSIKMIQLSGEQGVHVYNINQEHQSDNCLYPASIPFTFSHNANHMDFYTQYCLCLQLLLTLQLVAQALDLSRFKSRSEEHTSELQSPCNLVCRLLLEKKKKKKQKQSTRTTTITPLYHTHHIYISTV